MQTATKKVKTVRPRRTRSLKLAALADRDFGDLAIGVIKEANDLVLTEAEKLSASDDSLMRRHVETSMDLIGSAVGALLTTGIPRARVFVALLNETRFCGEDIIHPEIADPIEHRPECTELVPAQARIQRFTTN
jgi:hypothetical protein